MNDELNPDVRRLVDLTRKARTPGEGDKLRVAKRLVGPLAAGSAVAGAAGAAKAASFLGGLGGKLAAGLILGAVAVGAVWTQSHDEAPPEPAKKTAPPALPAPPKPTRPEPSAEATPPAPEPALKPSAAPPSSHAKPSAHELEEEAALLHEAQTAWRSGQSAQALKLANEHARRFPHSQLANERDVLRVLSLCQLGQVASAKQVGARLLRSAKGSPWYQSVAESCAGN